MTSRERVLRAIEFGCPDRIPLFKGPDADIAGVGYAPAAGFTPREPGMDEWGCVRTSLNREAGDQGQVTTHPLSDWGAFDSYTFPDPFAPGRLDNAKDAIDGLHQEGLFAIGFIGKGPMHLLDDLRGFESYLMDIMSEPDRIEAMLEGIFRFLHGVTEQLGDLGADAVMLFDDQAMQSGPLFSMDLWCEHLKPRYTQLCALAHSKGCKVIMHACGEISQHLPELADAVVGKVLIALDERNLRDETVIVFSSDHGEGAASHRWRQKQAFYEESTRVPFIVAPPRCARAGEIDERLVNAGVDLYPTLCELAGIDAPHWLHGCSALGAADEAPDFVVIESELHGGNAPMGARGRMLRTDRWKYAAFSRGEPREQLFDLDTDPGEMHNLAVEPGYRSVLDAHRERLARWCRETDDCFSVPWPSRPMT